jgi:hypothetical protein
MAMPKEYTCPRCKNAVDPAATVCSNAECRAELALCSYCRDISTYTLVQRSETQFLRDKWRCDRCERVGVKCLTWISGGYCNGLARAREGATVGPNRPFCAACMGRVSEVARSVVSWSIMGAIGGLLRPRK